MDLIEKTPPVPLRDRPVGANTPLDHQILAVLGRDGGSCRPGEIAAAVGEDPQRVSARLRKLVTRKLVIKTAEPGAPARGPGAFLYGLPPHTEQGTAARSWSSPQQF